MAHFSLNQFSNDRELAQVAASKWLRMVAEAKALRNTHTVALSGGRITKTFLASIVEQARTHGATFDHVHFFWADERCVPPTDPESNFILADQLLFQPLKIKEVNIHRLRGELDQQQAVKEAIDDIDQIASKNSKGQPRLDLVILGMGEDGHVASLFPNASAETINCSAPFLQIDNSPKPPPKRLSMSFVTITAATHVWALVSGAGKEKAFQESISATGKTPLARVLQLRNDTQIFTDLPVTS